MQPIRPGASSSRGEFSRRKQPPSDAEKTQDMTTGSTRRQRARATSDDEEDDTLSDLESDSSTAPGAVAVAGPGTSQSDRQQHIEDDVENGVTSPLEALQAEVAPTEEEMANRLVARVHTEMEERVEEEVQNRMKQQVSAEAVEVGVKDGDEEGAFVSKRAVILLIIVALVVVVVGVVLAVVLTGDGEALTLAPITPTTVPPHLPSLPQWLLLTFLKLKPLNSCLP